jgi:hypothetical protein
VAQSSSTFVENFWRNSVKNFADKCASVRRRRKEREKGKEKLKKNETKTSNEAIKKLERRVTKRGRNK